MTAATNGLPDRIAFLGFGLIGGSIARALRRAGVTARLVAWTPAGTGPAEGRRAGLLDEQAGDPQAAVTGAGLVVLAGPPLAVLDLVRDLSGRLGGALASGATVTDVASTKAAIVAAAGSSGLPFVGGHPMAGREVSGAAAARADLFEGRPWVVVPGAAATAADVTRVEALALAVGARPTRMSADEHDAAVAAISHLPLVAAAALVEAVALSDRGQASWPTARGLAASGWSDMTRLARGEATMGAGILATNAAAVAERLRAYRAAIDAWITELEQAASAPAAAPVTGAEPALRRRLEAARAALEEPDR